MRKIGYILLFACMATACQDDWLKQGPTTGGAADEINGYVDNAKLSINGMARIMYMQHAAGSGYSGEPTIMAFMGETMGRDFIYTRYEAAFKDGENGVFNTMNERVWDYFPWTYYYELIMNANTLLENIDHAMGDDSQRKFVKAQALTFRAHAYSRLVELYSNTWDNSDGGTSEGVVLRLNTSNGSMPLARLADCYRQIYKDLEDAITLYDESGLNINDVYESGAKSVHLPDVSVAHAIYARAALNKEDYVTALAQAQLARRDHPLMSVAEYRSGFNTPNSEWIWGAHTDENYFVAYWAYQSFMAYNGTDAISRMRPPVASRELIDRFPDSDIRKGMFVHKGIYLEEGTDVDNTYQTIDASLGIFKCATTAGKITDSDVTYLAYTKAQDYIDLYIADNGGDGYASPLAIFPYTALKFSTPSNGTAYNVGCVPFIRSSEMLLIEAEANYFLDHTEAAQDNLIELNKTSGRDPEYTCTQTGDDLFSQITLYRRLELWGEGHSWFDCKRWHHPVVRTSLQNGGSFISTISGTFGANADDTFWKWVIPARETDFNEDIYKDPTMQE